MSIEQNTSRLRDVTEKTIAEILKTEKVLFDEQFRYALLNGGKRLRPIVTMLCCEIAGGKSSDARYAAAAMEMLHTFTLVHDDIMDNANTRRGLATLHKKWDVGTAILSGDEILALAYRALLKTKSKKNVRLVEIFTKAFFDVCEGQAYDKDFETRTTVTSKEYLKMIELKTSALFSSSAQLGGLIANVSEKKLNALAAFGKNIGIAFQIQDDYLDCFGDEKTFGKKIGGDIAEGKRTFFLVRALEKSPRSVLLKKVAQRKISASMIPEGIKLFEEMGLKKEAEHLVEKYTQTAITALNVFPQSSSKETLIRFILQLVGRKS
ncbi:MAG: polyprenyl synthetase family protein [Ignavibacteriales bacterium]|nr:polyprenyl synthetase family protein [Ignavibacteriales bacterium]